MVTSRSLTALESHGTSGYQLEKMRGSGNRCGNLGIGKILNTLVCRTFVFNVLILNDAT